MVQNINKGILNHGHLSFCILKLVGITAWLKGLYYTKMFANESMQREHLSSKIITGFLQTISEF